MPRRAEASASTPRAIVLTCEHAGNRVPRPYRALFRGAGDALRSHRGWDPGAFGVALAMSEALHAPLLFSRVTRLLVDLNRSLDNPTLLSEFSRGIPALERATLLDAHYHPHRQAVESLVRAQIDAGRSVVHLGVHSFVDALDGRKRDLDIGILFDPDRPAERAFSERWVRSLGAAAGERRVRCNEPYQGIDDGLTTHLRRVFPDPAYLGIEIEIRQGSITTARAQAEAAQSLLSALPV